MREIFNNGSFVVKVQGVQLVDIKNPVAEYGHDQTMLQVRRTGGEVSGTVFVNILRCEVFAMTPKMGLHLSRLRMVSAEMTFTADGEIRCKNVATMPHKAAAVDSDLIVVVRGDFMLRINLLEDGS